MLTCAVSGRKFRPTAGQGWYQSEVHRPGTILQMRVVHPVEVRAGWQPRDWLGRGPNYGCCGVLEAV